MLFPWPWDLLFGQILAHLGWQLLLQLALVPGAVDDAHGVLLQVACHVLGKSGPFSGKKCLQNYTNPQKGPKGRKVIHHYFCSLEAEQGCENPFTVDSSLIFSQPHSQGT